MDLTTITVAQFKAQFFRGFAYLPVYSATTTYNTGDEAYYNGLFYNALVDGVLNVTPGTNALKWVKVVDSVDNFVMDADITNAFAEAQTVLNQSLYSTDATITLVYLYLTAHFLCNDIKTALAGLAASGSFPVASKGAGSVNEAYDIPQAYKDSPILSQYTSSAYGMKYLAMTLPSLVGNVVGIEGAVAP